MVLVVTSVHGIAFLLAPYMTCIDAYKLFLGQEGSIYLFYNHPCLCQ